MLNKVMLIGNVGKDPEGKVTPNGQSVTRFTLATSERWTDEDGAKQERTDWHNITVWGKQAELVSSYVHKGSLVFVEGSIRTSSWDDKESGQKKYKTEINATKVTFLDKKKAE